MIPGFATRYDISDLVTCFAPRRLLVLSATTDEASQDADSIVAAAQTNCAAMGVVEHIKHNRYEGEHALTHERFDDLVDWLVRCVG